MPLLQKAFEEFGEEIDIVALARNGDDDLVLVEEYSMTLPFLDESTLNTSFAYEIETVPTLVLATPDGTPPRTFVGFGRDDWKDLFEDLAMINKSPLPEMDWDI